MEKLKLVKISDIKVSRNFRNSVPSPEKMDRYRDAYCLGKDSKHSYDSRWLYTVSCHEGDGRGVLLLLR